LNLRQFGHGIYPDDRLQITDDRGQKVDDTWNPKVVLCPLPSVVCPLFYVDNFRPSSYKLPH
jgi:hypothetical protein